MMEETTLQRLLAEKFLDTDLEIDDDAKEAVTKARDLLKNGDLEALGDRIDDLESTVEDQERRMSNEIQEARVAMRKRVNGMRRLNERVERVSEHKIQAVHELLKDWDWKGQVYRKEANDFEMLEERAADYGEDMRRFFEECREDLFDQYEGTELESVVDGFSSEKRLSFDNLSDEQVDQLRESDLAEHVELSLS
jgi:uncharacterized coiled-coil protein SlyX